MLSAHFHASAHCGIKTKMLIAFSYKGVVVVVVVVVVVIVL